MTKEEIIKELSKAKLSEVWAGYQLIKKMKLEAKMITARENMQKFVEGV